MKKIALCLLLLLLAACLSPVNSEAAQEKFASWSEMSKHMENILNQSYETYFKGDAVKSKAEVNKAYYGYYEKHGFERTVMTHISGSRASTVELKFARAKSLMTKGAPNKEVRAELDSLIKMLNEDAAELDGTSDSAIATFLAALFIILREGLEAILVIAAIAAYLNRSGNKAKVRVVYISALWAVLASVAAAYVMQQVLQVSGASQEIIEGASMLLACVVLYFVSNWMYSKAEAEAWKSYIEGKVESSVQTGSAFTLGFAAFLAVFREGAETILFYQAMFADKADQSNMVWAGFGVGCVALIGVFWIIRFGSMRLPLKPFFIATSLLMYLMAFAFAGGGVKELQEGDVIGVTPVDFVPQIDLLGIYPSVETLAPQILMLLLTVFAIVKYRRQGVKKRVAA